MLHQYLRGEVVLKDMLNASLARKGQISMEYLAVFTIMILLVLPLTIIFITQTDNVRTDITAAEVQKISSKLIDYAEEVYFMGEPAQKTLQVYFPQGINVVSVEGQTIIFNVSRNEKSYLITRDSVATMNGSIRPFSGYHVIVFKSENETVYITDR